MSSENPQPLPSTTSAAPCAGSATGARAETAPAPWDYFKDMIDHCYDYAEAAKAQGRPVVGIMCEFTPRELILAAGGVPVCLCGGSNETVPPAEQTLPANLCPLIKSTFGYHVTGRNPFLKWADLVVAETTCDGKKKMFELLGETKPMHVLELPQKADDPDAREHWVREIRKLKAELERRFQTEITEAKLRQAIQLMNRERSLRRRLAELMAAEDPPLTGLQLLDCRSIISGIAADFEQYSRILDWAKAPIQSRRTETQGSAHPPAGSRCPSRASQGGRRVRVLLTGVPVAHGAERVVELIEAAGAVIVCSENCTGLKPILEDVDETAEDPIQAIADKYFHLPCSVMTPNRRRFDSLRQLAAQYRPDCVIELVWQACLTYDVESSQVRRLVEDELHLHYLKIVTDYSPADSARITSRLEALFEMTRD